MSRHTLSSETRAPGDLRNPQRRTFASGFSSVAGFKAAAYDVLVDEDWGVDAARVQAS